MSDATPSCRRCGRAILANRDHAGTFEGMHRLCFHLEYEHPGDPDAPCADPGCPEWQRRVLEEKLAELGHDPRSVVEAAVLARARRDG